jgi:acyl carrier protein
MSINVKVAEILKTCSVFNDSDFSELEKTDLFDIAEKIESFYNIQLNNDSLIECKTIADLIKLVRKSGG